MKHTKGIACFFRSRFSELSTTDIIYETSLLKKYSNFSKCMVAVLDDVTVKAISSLLLTLANTKFNKKKSCLFASSFQVKDNIQNLAFIVKSFLQ